MRNIFILITALIISGCSSITEQIVPVATVDSLEEGNAIIIVQRRAENDASVHLAEVTDNGEVIGMLGVGVNRSKYQQDKGDKHQLVWQRPAGEMRLKLTPATMVKDAPPIIENVEPGKTYKYIVRFRYSPYGLNLEKDG